MAGVWVGDKRYQLLLKGGIIAGAGLDRRLWNVLLYLGT